MMNIILVGYAADKAAHKLIENEKPALSCRFSDRFLKNAYEITGSNLINHDSIMRVLEGLAAYIPEENIMELSDMGIFGGLWEFADAHGVGVNIYLDKITISQETVEICEYLDVNPYTYPSQGAWIIRCENGYELADRFNSSHIMASVIGNETDRKDRIVINQDEIRYLTPADRLLKDEQNLKNYR